MWEPAQAADDIRLDPRDGQFNEVLRDGAKISGVVIVGVMQHGADLGPSLGVELAPNWTEKNICVRVLSSDGFYEAENIYPLPDDWSGGRAELAFPTLHGDILSALPKDGVAVRIEPGDCSMPTTKSALALWNGDNKMQSTILINAFAADEVFVYAGETAIRCEALLMSGLSAYGHACQLPNDLHGAIELTVYRVKNGKAPDPTYTSVWLGLP